MRIARARAERFGALVAVEELAGARGGAAVVAIDRALARRAGIEGGALWEGDDPGLGVRALEAPSEVHVAVTERCPAGCTGCYADARADGGEPSFDELAARLRELAALGVLSVALGGGEAMLRDDLPRLGARARELGMTPTVTTSGLGLDAARARALRGIFAQVNVSHDGVGGAYREVRGFDGARVAERAMAHLREAGVPFGANTVVTRASFDRLEATAAHVEALGAIELQLVRWKPSGRGRLDYLARRLRDAQIAAFPALLRRMSEARTLGVRIDCALVPFLSGDPSIAAEDLVRFGVAGCEAGRSLMAMRSDGRVAGCSFWREETSPDARLPLEAAWRAHEALERFRAWHADPREPCASCALRPACRGGCRIVAARAGDPSAPDPECPRVRAHGGTR